MQCHLARRHNCLKQQIYALYFLTSALAETDETNTLIAGEVASSSDIVAAITAMLHSLQQDAKTTAFTRLLSPCDALNDAHPGCGRTLLTARTTQQPLKPMCYYVLETGLNNSSAETYSTTAEVCGLRTLIRSNVEIIRYSDETKLTAGTSTY